MVKSTVLWPALRISALYALFAGLWIVFSDQALGLLVPDPTAYAVMQTYKGWFFVFVTALLLYGMMRSELRVREADRDRLRTLVQEKDLLLRELHHRVRNNLQTAVGLVDIVAAQLADAGDRERMAECVRSIRAMALVHEELGRGEDGDRVDLRQYLQRLGQDILGAFDARRRGVDLVVTGVDASLDVERAVPLGLMVTELMTNSLKHAFGEGAGTVRLALDAGNGALRLEVADDGVGLPEGFSTERGDTLGMTIVSGLAAQAGIDLEFADGPGTRVLLSLPLSR